MTPDELEARFQELALAMALLEEEEALLKADFEMLESYRCAQALLCILGGRCDVPQTSAASVKTRGQQEHPSYVDLLLQVQGSRV
jgi:hypothetical protein